MANYFIKIKEKEIPVIVRNYRNTNSIKIYFKGNVLNISKSKYLSNKKMLEVIKQNEEQIYEQYMKILSPEMLKDEDNKDIIDKGVKRLLCIKTKEYLETRLPYWSQKMHTEYCECKVGDATSKYGSCVPSKKALHFSNRLIMLPEDKIDAIIVHELSHMTYANHSKQFYHLVQEYIPNYFEIDKWLKKNVNRVMI